MPRKPKPKPKPAPRRRRGSGSLTTLRDGTIRARLPAGPDGRRPAREFRAGHLAEAQAWLDAALHPEAAETTAPVMLREWAGVWHQTYVAPVRPPTTVRWNLYALRQLAPLYGVPVGSIRASALQAVLGALAVRVSPATVAAVAGVWRRCLAAAVDDDLIARNPAARLTLPAVPRRPPARHVTAAEVALLWPAIRGSRFEPAHALALGCGLRFGEILGLHWQHVDIPGRRIWVQHQFTNGVWRDLPKGRNPHWVPMPEAVADALARHRERQGPGAVLVLQSPHRGHRSKRERTPRPWSRDPIVRELHDLARSVGVEPFSPHAGRHGVGSHLLAHGVDAATIGERLGNSPAVVLSTYVHATAGGRERADALVADYLPAPQTDPMDEIGLDSEAASPGS